MDARPTRAASPAAAPIGRAPAAGVRGAGPSALRRTLGFLLPSLLVAVGYVDPGNWATGLAAGSAYGEELLFVVLASSLAGMLLQGLAAKLGIVTGRDLAQLCRDRYGPRVRIALWILCEIAICACDLAELLGAAIALKLLFGLPLAAGAALTAFDVLLLIGLDRAGAHRMKAVVVTLMAILAGALIVELAIARPDPVAVARGLIPGAAALADPGRLYLAVGIVGATVMPHNLYLHSALVRGETGRPAQGGPRAAIRAAVLAGVIALALAGLANGALVALAAASFHAAGTGQVNDLALAHQLLIPLLGPLAAMLFAAGLLASAQNATITGTLAGQIVMEGFLRLRIAPWKRRILTRTLALAPALVCLTLFGDEAAGGLLIASQVALSLQLPFALGPLIRFTADRGLMGDYANGRVTTALATVVFALIVAADGALLAQALRPH